MKVLFFDLETTDLDGYAVEGAFFLVEIGKKSRLVRSYVGAFNPEAPVSREVIKKFYLDPEALRTFPTFREEWKRIKPLFLESDLVVAHNVQFDLKILCNELERIGERPNFRPKEYYRYHVACTCRDTKAALRFKKLPTLEEWAREMETDFEKAREFSTKVCKANGYSPNSIRTSPVELHSASFDTSLLAFSFLKVKRKKPLFFRFLLERRNNPKLFREV